MKILCPKCKNTEKFYYLKDGRLKCPTCKKYFTLEKKEIHISKKDLEKVLEFLIQNKSTNYILENLEISKFKLLKIKKLLRKELEINYKNILKLKKKTNNEASNTFSKCCSLLENSPKNFLSFLENNLKSKGGIREIHLKDFIYEYFWKFKNSKKSLMEQKEELFKLIEDKFWFK